jgi:hypothetical protein
MFRSVGREIVFTDFPFKSNVATYGPISSTNPAPPFQNWRADIPELIIEGINCYLNAFIELVGDACSDEDRQPDGSCISVGGKKKRKTNKRKGRKTNKKRTRKNKSRKYKK